MRPALAGCPMQNEIEEATCVTLLQKILGLLLDHLVKRKWEAWPFNDGNPFTVVSMSGLVGTRL